MALPPDDPEEGTVTDLLELLARIMRAEDDRADPITRNERG